MKFITVFKIVLSAAKDKDSARDSLRIIGDTIANIWHGFLSSIPLIIGGIIIILVALLVVKIFNKFALKLLSRFHLKENYKTLLS